MTDNTEWREKQPAGRRVGPFTVLRDSHAPILARHVKLVAGIGFALTLFHDLIYRQTGGTDFALYGVLSHAGADLLALTIAVTIAVFVVPERDR